MGIILVIDAAAPIRWWRRHPAARAYPCTVSALSDLIIVDMLMPELNGLQTIMEFTREFLNRSLPSPTWEVIRPC